MMINQNSNEIQNKIFDLIIVGAGPGGYETAIYASNNGLKTLLIEKEALGGTCLNCGCIPTKAIYSSANIIDRNKRSIDLGVSTAHNFFYKNVNKHKAETITELQKGLNFSLKKANVEVLFGEAKLVGQNEVYCNNDIYTAENIILATGSSDIKPSIPGIETTMGSKDILELDDLPMNMCIVGGGVIGVEMASIMATFGVNVDLIEQKDFILPMLDIEISRRVQSYLRQIGVKIHVRTTVKSFKTNMITFEEKGEKITLEPETILVCAGRTPNVMNLGLEEVGVTFSTKGINVNDNFQTNIKNIYAIGDCNNKILLAHYATYSGKKVVDDILNHPNYTNFSLVPSVIYSFPEIATIGLTEEQMKALELDYVVKKSLYRANGMAFASGEIDGFIKIIIANDRLVGVHIVGCEASNLIHEASIMMNANIPISQAKDFIFAHPTFSEIFKDSLQ